MSCSVRAMREADLDRVMAIADSLVEAPRWPRGAYVAALRPGSAPRRIALVAEQEAAIAGFVVASVVGRQAELESIAVVGEAQGRGVGGNLLAQLIAELRLAGVGELDLEVRESNRAGRRLYERAGFREVGRRRGYYQEPVADAILLRLGLS
jgi:ribosomal-protein-alanine N-acetyltransferase